MSFYCMSQVSSDDMCSRTNSLIIASTFIFIVNFISVNVAWLNSEFHHKSVKM